MNLEKNPTWIPVVAVALRDRAGRWLMHRRPADKQHGGLWEFPGGKVEPAETPVNALIREIREELGIALPVGALAPAAFAEEPVAAGKSPIVILLYTCAAWRGEPQALEGGAVGWFTMAEIAALAMPPLDHQLAELLFANSR